MPINISEIKRCIDERPEDFRTLRDVACKAKVSPETLRREFFRAQRMHLSEYLTAVRVRRMQEMLLMTQKPCFEICFDAGFRREDTGAKVFKRITGMTMAQYRGGGRNRKSR
jgi:methylphosphotriester-DNA--protein-cysteine methyltransferase